MFTPTDPVKFHTIRPDERKETTVNQDMYAMILTERCGMTQSSLMLDLLGQRVIALESLDGDQAAVEGFAILRQLENVLVHAVTGFKTLVTKGWSDFKRSELRTYQDAHHGDVRAVLDQKNWITFSHLSLHITQALQAPFPHAAEHVAEMLKEAQYRQAITVMTQAIAACRSTGPDIQPHIIAHWTSTLTKLWGSQGYVPTDAALRPYVVLSDRGLYDRNASDVFSSMSDVTATLTHILSYEVYFREAVTDQAPMTALEASVSALVDQTETIPHVSSAYLTELHRLVCTFSQFLSGYASFLQAAQLLEHSFVLCLKSFAKTL